MPSATVPLSATLLPLSGVDVVEKGTLPDKLRLVAQRTRGLVAVEVVTRNARRATDGCEISDAILCRNSRAIIYRLRPCVALRLTERVMDRLVPVATSTGSACTVLGQGSHNGLQWSKWPFNRLKNKRTPRIQHTDPSTSSNLDTSHQVMTFPSGPRTL